MEDMSLTPEMLALVPLVAAIMQIVKKIPNIDKIKPYLPFIGMVIAFGLLYTANPEPQFMEAVVIGLMASGAYDGIKAISK